MNKNKGLRYCILAGEDSGDLHGAQIIKHLKLHNNNILFSGIGGNKMEQFGFKSLVPIEQLAIMGFTEVLKKLFFFLKLEKIILKHIKDTRPCKIILIDYPGFNLRIAKKIKKISDAMIIYYISPQLWAWKEGRLPIIKKYIDRMIVVFPFEVSWYKQRGVAVDYFGHPLIEKKINYNYKKSHKKSEFVVGLCPGSRKQEIITHMPELITFVQLASSSNPHIRFILYQAPSIADELLQKYCKNQNIEIERGNILHTFHNIDFAVVASGTATLECAISLIPMVVVYKMSFFSWLITKCFVASPFASIVNILAKQQVVKEFLQNDFSSKNIYDYFQFFINDRSIGEQIIKDYSKIISSLGRGQAYKQTAQFIYNV